MLKDIERMTSSARLGDLIVVYTTSKHLDFRRFSSHVDGYFASLACRRISL